MGGNNTKDISQAQLPNNYGWFPNDFKEYDVAKHKVLNVYKSLDRLGKGGFGTVFKVEHVGSRAVYALKYIPINEDVEKATMEFEVMKKISHKSIVRVHSSFPLIDGNNTKDPVAYCIVMDFVEGGDLRDYMQRLSKPLPKNYVMECFIKLTDALNYLHQQGIFHCDIKPENIIVSQCEQGVNVTIVDFGSAGFRAGKSIEGGTPLQGTVAYMAPELIKCRKVEVNGKADMWALGCILYEIWTQDSSFVNESFGMASKLGKDRALLTKLDDLAIEQLLSNLLNPDPAIRWTAEKLMNSPIFKGWRVAIDESHTERGTFPNSALFLFPFITVLNFPSSQPSLCLSNLQYITQWLRSKDFHRVFVEFNCSLSLIRFISQSTEADSIALALNILSFVLNHEYGTNLAYQICANHIGISTLLKKKGLNEILKLLRYSFGHATLKRCFAIDNLVLRLLQSSQIENIKVGRGLYEDLPETTVPLAIYLDKIGKIATEPSVKIEFIADLLNNHKDIPNLLPLRSAVYDKMEKLLCSCLAIKSEHTPRLLQGLLFMVKSSSCLTKCINHRVCTAEVTGSVKYQQYIWFCDECKLHTCVSCAKSCHTGCSGGYYYQGAVGCMCGLEGYCKCVRHSFDEVVVRGRERSGTTGDPPSFYSPVLTPRTRSNSHGDTPSRFQTTLRNTEFNLSPLVPAPHVEVDYSSPIRYWEATEELKLPPFSAEEKAKQHFINKGFVLSKPKNPELSTVFYYEIEILAPPVGRNACLAMGVLHPYRKDYDFSTRALGLADWEYGYHGNDGQAFYAETKVANYGPIYSTGDRVGCGVMSDGTVYFTLNGIWLGCPNSDLPKIAYGATVCSVVTITGYGSHIKFIFDSSSFMFVPDVQEFEVANYFKEEPYVHLPLLRAAFGDNESRVFDLLKSVELDLGASLLHALCYNNPRFARELSKIFHRFSDSSSRFSRFMMELISTIQNAKPDLRASVRDELGRSSPREDSKSSILNFRDLIRNSGISTPPHSPHLILKDDHTEPSHPIPLRSVSTHSPKTKNRTNTIPSSTHPSNESPFSPQSTPNSSNSDSFDNPMSPRSQSPLPWMQGIRRQPSREIPAYLSEEANNKLNLRSGSAVLKKSPSIPKVPAFFGESGNVPPIAKSKPLFASNDVLHSAMNQQIQNPHEKYQLLVQQTAPLPQTLNRRQELFPIDTNRSSPTHFQALSSSSSSFSSTSSSSPLSSPTSSPFMGGPSGILHSRLAVEVCTDRDLSDVRELMLEPEQQTMDGICYAFINEAFKELKDKVVVYQVNRVDKSGQVRLMHDKSIEALRGREKLVFYITENKF